MKYEIVAYKILRYTMEVEATNSGEACKIAKLYSDVNNKWQKDYDFYDFTIKGVEEKND